MHIEINKSIIGNITKERDTNYEITLGDFIDDLTIKNLSPTTSPSKLTKIINISEHSERLNVLSFLPEEWQVSSSYSSSMISYLRNADPQGYKTGDYIHDVFFDNPTNCKKVLTEHISKLLSREYLFLNHELFKEYILSIIDLDWSSMGDYDRTSVTESSYNRRMNNYIGDGDLGKNIKRKILFLLKQNRYDELISLFLLSFLIMPLYPYDSDRKRKDNTLIKNKDEKNAKIVLTLIWFSESEIVERDIDFSVVAEYKHYICYAYAQLYYKQKKYEHSFDIIESIRNKPSKKHLDRAKYYYLYAQHLILGRGVKKDVSKALKMLLKNMPTIYQEESENTHSIDEITIRNFQISKYIALIEDIISYKYGKINANNYLSKLIEFELPSNKMFGDEKSFNISLKSDVNLIENCYYYALFLMLTTKFDGDKQYAKFCFEFVVQTIEVVENQDLKEIYNNSKKSLSQLNKGINYVINKTTQTDKIAKLGTDSDISLGTLVEQLSKQIVFDNKNDSSNISNTNQQYYITNSNSYVAKIFLREFENLEISALDNADVSMFSKAINQKVSIVLFSENESKNLNDCLAIIENFHKYIKSNRAHVKQLQNNVDVYVLANYESASIMVDAALNLHNGYLKIHICDYDKLVAQQLIIKAPFFIPSFMKNSSADIVVFGTNKATFQLAKEIIGTSYINNIPSLTFIGNEGDSYKNKLEQLCPGIYKEDEIIPRIKPEFYNCNIDELDFIDLFSNPLSDEDIFLRNRLYRGNYFVVDVGDDIENILFAMKLRGWILSCDNMFKRTPFIAVKCKDSRNAAIAKHLVVNNKISGTENHNNYNLFLFGSKESIFIPDNLDIQKNSEKRMALNFHLAYYGENIDEEEKEKALESYFKFSYNRDSSECGSISINYMLYCMGLIRSLKDLKLGKVEIAEKYNKWLKKNGSMESASRYEHSRWVGYMLSRSWRSATLEQVEAYSGQESGTDHKHLLCKLHPFICNYDDLLLDDTEENVKINALKNGIKNLKLPIESTNNIVSSIGKILTNNPFVNKESNVYVSR